MAVTELETVNACLAIMGETKLNTLAEDHAFKGNALDILKRNDRSIQGKGWWYNTENIKLVVNPVDHRVYLPEDALAVRPSIKDVRGRYMQRGRVMYDLHSGTDLFDDTFTLQAELVRRVPLDDVPFSVQAYISRKTVLDFQQEFDGDQTKTRNLQIEIFGNAAANITGLRGMAEAEHIRSVAVNLIDNSERLWRVRRVISYPSRY